MRSQSSTSCERVTILIQCSFGNFFQSLGESADVCRTCLLVCEGKRDLSKRNVKEEKGRIVMFPKHFSVSISGLMFVTQS